MTCKTEEKTASKQDANKAVPADTAQRPSREVAEWGHFGLTHGLVDWLGNSALSLYITYNIMPTEAAQKAIDGITHAIAPAARTFGLRNPELRVRGTVETMCMCGAGFAALPVMKYLSENKESIVNSIDHWWNSDFYDKHPRLRQENISREKEAKEKCTRGWGSLITARLAALGAIIFGLDQGVEAINSFQRNRGRPNIDTVEWKFGSYLYDHLPTGLRDNLSNFFSRKGASVESIQPLMRERLAQTVGNDARRMVFSEQARMVQKELSYTFIYAGMMCALGALDWGKILGKKDSRKDEPASPENPSPSSKCDVGTLCHAGAVAAGRA